MSINAVRGSVLHFPTSTTSPETNYVYIKDALLVTRNGKILKLGDAQALLSEFPDIKYTDYSGKLILPGFIDSHLHFPQTEMIASYGEQLLEWLENYTFPTEIKFKSYEYAYAIAKIFIQQLLKNGTTSAMVYSTVHKSATDALFQQAQNHNMLMIAGKVCMDRNCPPELQDTPKSAQQESDDLISKWHKKDRLFYALTPRFAPTSSAEQMAMLGELAQQYSDVFIQTHLSENTSEIDWVKSLYPGHANYLDVYDYYHMVRPRAVFGHCLHLESEEWSRLTESGSTIAFCPTSNLFLGSGLFDLKRAKQFGVNVSLATDVGAGTSFSMLKTMGEAYKVCQLQKVPFSPFEGLYLMTQGAACSLGLSHAIGNLNPESDADFIVIDPQFDELMKLRIEPDNSTVSDILFALSMLGDDRAIFSTWIAGQPAYLKQESFYAMD